MRAIRLTCVSLGFTLAAAVAAGPASAAACAEQFPFICLFGPEAQAMLPAAPIYFSEPEDLPRLEMRRPRKRVVARKAAPVAQAVAVAEAAPAVEAKTEEPPISLAALRLGPGPAFEMSLRLSPTMQEQVKPPSSACMIEQTFNDLFRIVPEDHKKLAETDPAPIRPLAMIALKTGGVLGADREEEYSAAPPASVESTQIK